MKRAITTLLLAMAALAPPTAAQDASTVPRTDVATSIPVRFAVAPTDPADTTLILLLDRRDCGSSGKDSTATVGVLESPEEVSVRVEVRPGPDGQLCGGAELTRIEAALDGPLGTRAITDGATGQPALTNEVDMPDLGYAYACWGTPSFSVAQLLGPGPDISAYGIDTGLDDARALVDEGDLVILRGRIRENGTTPLETWRLRSGEWYHTSGDSRCELSAVIDPNLAGAPWSLKRPWPKPGARTITIKVQEWACNAGRPPTGRVPPPTVHYTPDAIYLVAQTIPNSRTWQENAVSGSHMFVDCQGAPPAVYTVHLARRVRDRDLYDGGSFPPKRKTRPEDR